MACTFRSVYPIHAACASRTAASVLDLAVCNRLDDGAESSIIKTISIATSQPSSQILTDTHSSILGVTPPPPQYWCTSRLSGGGNVATAVRCSGSQVGRLVPPESRLLVKEGGWGGHRSRRPRAGKQRLGEQMGGGKMNECFSQSVMEAAAYSCDSLL